MSVCSAADDMKANVGKIETIVSDPTAANQVHYSSRVWTVVTWRVSMNSLRNGAICSDW